MDKGLKHEVLLIICTHYRMLTAELQRQLNLASTNDDVNAIMRAFKDDLINCNKIAEELRKEETK